MRFFRDISLAGTVALLCVSALRAQDPTATRNEAASLPSAPSAVLAQYGAGTPAGSGKVFTPGSAFRSPAGITVERAADGPLPLSIDDAVALALTRNLRIHTDRANLDIVRGDRLQVTNALVPALRLKASSSAEELNLAAMGFKPSAIKFPGFTGTFPTIVKVNITQALLSLNQQLFNVPAYELLRGAQEESKVVELNALIGRGDVVQAVTSGYLRVLADQASLADAQALEAAGKTIFEQGAARRDAGVGTSLDALRAQVEFQTRQQQRIAAEAQLARDVIQLNRIMGLPAEQLLTLTDSAPFAQLADMDLDRARTTAYQRRKDYLSLLAQIRVADRERLAVKFQRLPTVAFSGYYGVIGVTDGLYHGVFNATGSLRFPVFREAAQRGEAEILAAQLTSLRQREQSLRNDIDAQIRSSLLDVQSSAERVKVAQSNVELARQALSDERDRLQAGVDDNLPVVDAQAQLAGAQSTLVRALYDFNTAKLSLARSTGIIESQYRTYLGTSIAANSQPAPVTP